MNLQRVVLIVLDGVGVGAAPDARAYGDEDANSVANTARILGGLQLPRLARLGLGNIVAIDGVAPDASPTGYFGRLTPAAAGKDSTSGHWEMMGCVLDAPLPTYPDGFPDEIIEPFCEQISRRVLGNVAASGTEIIAELGEEHMRTGSPIVYTSQDSVFQVAAHERVIAVDDLYEICRTARALLMPPHGVGRVIARPFSGTAGGYFRTSARRDFSLPSPCDTVLDAIVAAGKRVTTIGKVDDLFAGRGVSRAVHTRDNRDGMAQTLDAIGGTDADLIFTNLVDFDTMWGHRNDARAYALGLEEFDAYLGVLLGALRDEDLLVITSDHGNDPTTQSADHSREFVPLVVHVPGSERGGELGTRDTLADVGATVADVLGAEAPSTGRSFLGVLA